MDLRASGAHPGALPTLEVEAFLLVGGLSRRFSGYPKGLLTAGGQRLVDALAALLIPLSNKLTLLGDPEGPYHDLGYPICWEPTRGYGAVGAVYGALELSEAPYCWIFACDLVGVQRESLLRLLRRAALAHTLPPTRRPHYFGYRDEHGPQPLAGLWSKKALRLLPPLQKDQAFPPLRALIQRCQAELEVLPLGERWGHWNQPSDRFISEDRRGGKSCH